MRVNDIFCHEKERRFLNINNSPLLVQSQPIVACKNVDFSYNKMGSPILSDVNIEIYTGQHIAFVGATGSGKSTLAKLICALFQANSGKIEVYGNDISSLSPENIAEYFAYVSQDVSLFSGRIYENLTLWKKNISFSEIQKAIYTANLDEIIASRSLEGKVEENGDNFSGGEKQRLDIARALIQNSHVLVLDEATSALDIQTEKTIIDNLKKMNKTIIFVAHRLSTIQHCDQILVLENGQIVERGRHDQLILNKSYYYDLIQNEQRMLLG